MEVSLYTFYIFPIDNTATLRYLLKIGGTRNIISRNMGILTLKVDRIYR